MTSALAGAALASSVTLAGPHLMPLDRVVPLRAAAVWLAALLARALLVVAAALVALSAIPRTEAFESVAQLSTHEILPPFAFHIDLSADPLAHGAILLPSVLLGLSVAVFLITTGIRSRAFNSSVSKRSLGSGPQGSTVVADERPLIAVPGLGPRRVIVSHAALALLDDRELRASLAHEHAHLGRGHRLLRLVGALLARTGALLPGTAASHAGLKLSLERDADQHAIRSGGDPLALASAILKTVGGQPTRPLAVLALTGAQLSTVRLDQLLAGGRIPAAPAWNRLAVAMALALGLCCLGLFALIAWALGSPGAGLGGIALALACPT